MDKDEISGGAIIWARQTIESEIFNWKPSEWFKIWFLIVSQVNHSDRYGLKRSEGLFTYEKIRLSCRVTLNQVKHCLEYLREANMIATRRTTRGLIIKVLNYERFQNLDNYRLRPKSQSERYLHDEQKPYTSPPINNNDNNEEYLNSKSQVKQETLDNFRSDMVNKFQIPSKGSN